MGRVEDALTNEEIRNKEYLFMQREDVTSYRVTGVQLAEKCGPAWKAAFLSRDGITPPVSSTNKWTITGTLIHLFVENELQKLQRKDQILSTEDIARIREILAELEELYTLSNCYKYLQRLFSYTFGKDIVAVEKDFVIPNNLGVNLSGHADLVMRDRKTGRYTILDHKTDRRPSETFRWEAKFQIQAYGNAACVEYEVDEVDFIIGNVNLEEDNKFVVKKSLRTINLRIAKALENIDTGYRSVGAHCYSCSLKDDCAKYQGSPKANLK